MTRGLNRFERHARLTIVTLLALGAILGGGIFEALYRSQIIDFYRPELRRVNSPDVLASTSRPTRTILALGDSFTAWPDSYPTILAQELSPSTRVINAGVSGFTLRQVARVLPLRLDEFDPDVVIIQLFAGNDLVEMAHPVNWTAVNPVRNALWTLSDGGLESLSFLTHRTASILGYVLRRTRADGPPALEVEPAFSVELYSAHERGLIAADPGYVQKQLAVEGHYRQAFDAYLEALDRVLNLASAKERRTVFVLLVPHAMQVHERYRQRFALLGAAGTNDQILAKNETPLSRGVVAAIARHAGVHFLDPLPLLRQAEASGQTVIRARDLHFTPEGQRLIADALLAELSRLREDVRN